MRALGKSACPLFGSANPNAGTAYRLPTLCWWRLGGLPGPALILGEIGSCLACCVCLVGVRRIQCAFLVWRQSHRDSSTRPQDKLRRIPDSPNHVVVSKVSAGPGRVARWQRVPVSVRCDEKHGSKGKPGAAGIALRPPSCYTHSVPGLGSVDSLSEPSLLQWATRVWAKCLAEGCSHACGLNEARHGRRFKRQVDLTASAGIR